MKFIEMCMKRSVSTAPQVNFKNNSLALTTQFLEFHFTPQLSFGLESSTLNACSLAASNSLQFVFIGISSMVAVNSFSLPGGGGGGTTRRWMGTFQPIFKQVHGRLAGF